MDLGANSTVNPGFAEKLKQINAVLLKLSQDEDLHDDFKLAPVKVAIDHWTGVKRLDVDRAQQLQNNRRVVYVLQRFQMLQSVCKDAGMPVPLDHLLLGKTKLDENIAERFFGVAQSVPKGKVTKEAKKSNTSLAPDEKSKPAVESVHQDEAHSPSTKIPKQDSVEEGMQSTTSENYDVNALLKILIAIVFILIGITLAQLL